MAEEAEPTVASTTKAQARALSTQTWVSATFLLLLTALLSKGLGFVRDLLVANYFGASAQVDAFMVAATLAAAASGIGSALASTLVPVYRRALVDHGQPAASRLAGGATGLTLVLASLAMLTLLATPRFLVRLIAPALPEPTLMLAAELTRWLTGLVLGINMIYILSAVYNAVEHFKIPSLMDVGSNVFVLLALVLFSAQLGIRALAIGLGVATVIIAVAMAIPIFARGITVLNFRFRSPLLRELPMLAAPVFLWELLAQGGNAIENFFGATLEPGSISALGYAKRLSVLLVSLVAVNIARAVFPVLSRLVSERKLHEARDLMVKLGKQYLIAFVPISIALMYFRQDVVRVIFMRGAFDAAAVAKTSTVLMYYAAGIVLMAIGPICVRACYAFADTATPLLGNAGGLLAMGALNYLLTPRLGVSGIALSTTLAVFFSVGMMGRTLRRRLGGLDLRALVQVGGFAAVCGVAALAPGVAMHRLFPAFGSGVSGLAIGLAMYFTAYGVLGWFIMRREVRTLWSLLRNEL